MKSLNAGLTLESNKALSLASDQWRTHKIHIIKDLHELRSLQSEWDEIAATAEVEPWQSFSWVHSAATAFNITDSLRIITVRNKDKLTAIAPLVIKYTNQPLKQRQLHILGGDELKEPNRLIYCDQLSYRLLINEIAKEPVYPIRLSRLVDDNETTQLLYNELKRNGWFVGLLKMPYPYINLDTIIPKKSLKKDIRRATNKAKRYGELKFKTDCQLDKEKLPVFLRKAFEIEASGWKGENRSAILYNEHRKRFFESYARNSLLDGTLRLFFLCINNEYIAVQYAIESDNEFWLLNIGYNEAFAECSPGNLLLDASIQYAINARLYRYNFLGKVEPWTLRWTQTQKECTIISAYRANLVGVRAMFSDAMFLSLKKYRDWKQTKPLIGKQKG